MPSKLGRKRDYRNQQIINLAVSILDHGKITTTSAKAKAVVPYLEKVLTIAKQDSVTARRHISKLIHNVKISNKIFKDILPNIKDSKSGGFTNTLKLNNRNGDNAPMVVVSLNDLLLKKKEIKKIEAKKPVSENA